MNATHVYEYKINVFLSEHTYMLSLILIILAMVIILGLVCIYTRCIRKKEESTDNADVIEIEMVDLSGYVQMDPAFRSPKTNPNTEWEMTTA